MIGILIANIVVEAVAAVAIATLTVLWMKAERKLAKHGESKMFKVQEGKDVRSK